jgi:hypothetical protein
MKRNAALGLREFSLYLVLAVLAAMLTWIHLLRIDLPNYQAQLELHNQILQHLAPSPYQFRILQPWLVAGLLQVHLASVKTTFLFAYTAIRYASIFLALVAVRIFAGEFLPADFSILGSLLLAAVIPFTYSHYYYQPSSILELACFAWGFVLVAKDKWKSLGLLILVSTLNRETMVFLSLYYFLFHFSLAPKRLSRLVARSAMLLGAWLIPFGGSRLLWPAPSSVGTISQYISYNTTHPLVLIEAGLAFLPFFLVSLVNLKSKPANLLRCLWAIPFWLILCFLFGKMEETRLYLPMLIPELPLILLTWHVSVPGQGDP